VAGVGEDESEGGGASRRGGSSRTSAEEVASGSGGELAEALAQRRLYREVTLALQTGLRNAKAGVLLPPCARPSTTPRNDPTARTIASALARTGY
jgi:hypothetical protein